jgi:hypothetical protein
MGDAANWGLASFEVNAERTSRDIGSASAHSVAEHSTEYSRLIISLAELLDAIPVCDSVKLAALGLLAEISAKEIRREAIEESKGSDETLKRARDILAGPKKEGDSNAV